MSRTQLATRLSTRLRQVHTSQGNLNSTTAPTGLHVVPPQIKPLADVLPRGVTARQDAPLARLPAKNLVRSLFILSLMRRQWLLRPALAALGFICHTKMPLFNVDTNPFLNKILRLVMYDQYAAGATKAEVTHKTKEIRDIGFHGVIIGHAREVVLQNPADSVTVRDEAYALAQEKVIEEWKEEQLLTLSMINEGDFLALKLSGAGDLVSGALRSGKPMPPAIARAVDEICDAVRRQGSRVWLDAEQQAFQPTLDEWAIELMRKHNAGNTDQPVLYNTIQAYLKGARANAARHIQLASQEGWTVAIKLVRGAYIENEVRSLIHDTKEDTDRSYNDIASMLITQTMPKELSTSLQFPKSALFLATHNAESIEIATAIYQERRRNGLPSVLNMECGQVLGMADELGCDLLQRHTDAREAGEPVWARPLNVFKCSTRGTVAECLGYLYRRAVENKGAVERTEHMQRALSKEFRRRVIGW